MIKKHHLFLILVFLSIAAIESLGQTQTFTTSNPSWQIPAGVTSISIECWGGGGAGGGVLGAAGSTRAGGGGAGGAYVKNASVTVTPLSNVAITVGAGGAGVSTGDGGNGLQSSFGGLVVANGGAGGKAGNATTVYGLGGASTAGTYAGGAGAAASNSSGAGGGGAGASGDGGNASGTTGGTGGSGGGGAGAAGIGGTGNGSAGATLSGGGSGGRSTNATNRTGGNGAAGQVRVTYTLPDVTGLSTSLSGTACDNNGATFAISSSNLISDTYTIYYNVTGTLNSVAATTATMIFTAGSPGTGTFTTAVLANAENDVLHITRIANSSGNYVDLTNNTNFTVNTCRVWYTYQSGNYNDPTIWTLDPSGTTYDNGTPSFPTTGDEINILNGFTVTMNVSSQNLTATAIQGGGTLDMSTTTGHNLGVITGAGLLRVKGVALPSGTFTDFVSTSGGTIEYYDTGGTLPTAQTTYNHLMLSGYTASATYIEASDLTVNGTFTIGTGSGVNTATWQINDNSANRRTVTLNGDLNVNSNGAITIKGGTAATGSTATPHVITMYGDFTNNGTVRFFDNTASTNLLSDANWSLLTAASTSDVAGSVYIQTTRGFGSTVTFTGTDDQTVTCNGVTYFYNLIVNKGATTLPVLTINSSSTTNFKLFGPANYGSSDGGVGDGTGGPTSTSQNALSIANGTLQLTGSTTIPILGVGNSVVTPGVNALFALPQTARLWLNGANVSVNIANANTGNGDQRFILQGILQITNGTFTTGYTKGLVTGAAGALKVEGGILTTWQIRPAAGTQSLQNFSYVQSGGTVNVGTNSGTFTDPNTGASFTTPTTNGVTGNPNYKYSRFAVLTGTFQMSGGTLNVGQPTQPIYSGTYTSTTSIGPLAGGIDIESAAGNYNVTGGTVNVFIPSGAMTTSVATNTWTPPNNFTIYSTAPLYNLNVYKEGATASGIPPMVKLNYNLTVLNNLILVSNNSPTFDCNGTTYTYGVVNAAGTPSSAINNNLIVGGHLIINSGTTFIPSSGTGTITFNGSIAQSWTNGGTIGGTSYYQVTSGTTSTNFSVTTIPAVVVNKTGILTVTNSLGASGNIGSLTLTSGTLADNGNTITVTGTLTNNAKHTSTGAGSITYNAVNGTIGGTNGTFGNLLLSGTNSVTTMNGNQTVTGNLGLTGAFSSTNLAILNIGLYSLTVGGSITSTVGFGHNSYILTAGLHNAGGLTRTGVAGNVVFPVGVLVNSSTAITTNTNRQYTPNTINISSATAFGTITVRPVNNVHPNVTSASASLAYYWRVTSSGFTGLGTVQHGTYQFADGTGTAPTRGGTQGAYVAARYDRSANTWGYYYGAGTPAAPATQAMATTILPDPFNTATTWTNVTGSQLDGEYTCGNSSAFGPVTTYYSLQTGNWNNSNTWYTITNGVTVSPAASNPTSCPTCPVVIGDGTNSHYVTIPNSGLTAGQLQAMCGSLSINAGSTLDCGTTSNAEGALVFGTNTTVSSAVGGTGTLRIALATAAGTAGHFPSGDFTNFIESGGGTVEYYGTSTTALTVPVIYKSPVNANQPLNTYYNLVVSPFAGQAVTLPASGLTIYNNFTEGSASSYTGTVATNVSQQTISVGGSLTVSYGTFSLSAPANSTANSAATTFTVTGNIVNNGTLSCVASAATQTNTNTITVFGNITNNGTMNFRQYTSATQFNVADITFKGTSAASFGGTGTTTLDLVTVNKGTSQSPTLTCTLSGALNTTPVANGWLTLTNGTFDFEYTGATTPITLSTSAYTIPSTAKLKVGAGTMRITSGADNNGANDYDLFLNGALEVGGNATTAVVYTYSSNTNPTGTTNDNDIEYSAAGTPTITVANNGSLIVDGSIRRATNVLAGALVYNQTGGTVTVGGIASDDSRGIFEIEYNTGSSFTLTGATTTLNVQRQNSTGSTGYADVYINAISSNVSATSTITLGLATATTQSNLRVFIVPTIGNFAIKDGSGSNAQTVVLYNDLGLGGTLTIPSPSVLITTTPNPDADVTIGGDFVCGGTYNTAGSNTTTFNGTTDQFAVLTSTTDFYDVAVNKSSGALKISGTAPVAPGLNNLSILSGTLEVGRSGVPLSSTLKVNRNIIINGTQTGTQAVEIYSTTANSNTITSSGGSFTNLTLGGDAATKAVNVSGNLTINGVLNFSTTNRYLMIASSRLTFGAAATTPTGYGSTDYIRTNGVSSDLGITKTWGTGTTTFTYPIGVSTIYSPVSYSLNVTTGGDLTVIPVNSYHPTYNQTGEQILKYYWTVKRSSSLIATASGMHTYSFPSTLITGSGGTLSAGYLDPIATTLGWITSGHGGSINTGVTPYRMEFLTTPTTNIPQHDAVNETSYDYSVGTPGGTGTLPNPIQPLYSRLGKPGAGTGSLFTDVDNPAIGGSWIVASNWTSSPDGDLLGTNPSGFAPTGIPVVILPGATINITGAPSNGRRVYKTTINGSGVLNITTTTLHNLGIVSGTGTLRTGTNVLPGGDFTAFTSSAGGTMEFIAPVNMFNRQVYNNISIYSGTPGTVTMTAAALTINGNVTIPTGTILNGTGNTGGMAVAGNWTNAGTFTAGTGAISIAGSLTNSGTFTPASATSISLTGNLTNTGTFNAGASSNFSIAGNLINSTGTFNHTTGTVTFIGSSAQSTTGVVTFNNLTMNKTGNLTLGTTVNVNGILTMTSGNIISNTYTYPTPPAPLLVLGSAATNAGASASSFVSGQIRKTILSGQGFTFPVGSNSVSRYRPTRISNASADDIWNVSYIPNSPTTDNYSSLNINTSNMAKVSNYEYWQIANGTGTTTASLTLSYGPGSYGGADIGDESKLKTARWSGAPTSGGPWDIPVGVPAFTIAGTGISTDPAFTAFATSNNIIGTVTVTRQDLFSPQTLATDDPNSSLPIELVDFTARLIDSSVKLDWFTASEINNDYFTIERSSDIEHFEEVGKVKAKGNSKSKSNYSLTDNDPLPGISYYRLKQTDIDGAFTYSGLRKIENSSNSAYFRIYPNPLVDDKFEFELTGVEPGMDVPLKVLNLQGSSVFESSYKADQTGKVTASVKLNQAASGLYIVIVNAETGLRKKIVIP